MLLSDYQLEAYASGSIGLLGRLWVEANLSISEECCIRLAEIKTNIETETELKAALSALPDAGEPPAELSQRMASCKVASKR